MRAGFETYVVMDACKSIGLGDSIAATDAILDTAGVHRITTAMLE
jgi:nicotinamidase-related amidase